MHDVHRPRLRLLSPGQVELIVGEAYQEYRNGLPRYVRLKNIAVEKKLKATFKL